jgi:precorrin-6Y C5,15-methyltransferase (decarboxylating)
MIDAMDDNKIHIIGLTGGHLDQKMIELVQSCVLVVAGNTMLPVLEGFLPFFDPSRFAAITPLASAIETIGRTISVGNIAVVASGDPFFFGIGEILVRHFGKERLVTYPAVSSMQLLFSRLGQSWHDARFVSLHGRKERIPCPAILSSPKVCILTDRERTPSWLATELLRIIPQDHHRYYSMSVGEKLGGNGERVITGTLQEIASQHYADPNTVLLEHNVTPGEEKPILGLGEHEIGHSRGLITKNEIRAAALHNLRLPEIGVLWDIGAGSGSVSIEAARIAKNVEVYAVERDREQVAHITANRGKFHAWNVNIVEGEAPVVLGNLPDPDRVFIGGSGGNLAEIVEMVSTRLREGGRVIIAAVLETTIEKAPSLLHSHGFKVETTTITVERETYPTRQSTRLNPITLVLGRKHF